MLRAVFAEARGVSFGDQLRRWTMTYMTYSQRAKRGCLSTQIFGRSYRNPGPGSTQQDGGAAVLCTSPLPSSVAKSCPAWILVLKGERPGWWGGGRSPARRWRGGLLLPIVQGSAMTTTLPGWPACAQGTSSCCVRWDQFVPSYGKSAYAVLTSKRWLQTSFPGYIWKCNKMIPRADSCRAGHLENIKGWVVNAPCYARRTERAPQWTLASCKACSQHPPRWRRGIDNVIKWASATDPEPTAGLLGPGSVLLGGPLPMPPRWGWWAQTSYPGALQASEPGSWRWLLQALLPKVVWGVTKVVSPDSWSMWGRRLHTCWGRGFTLRMSWDRLETKQAHFIFNASTHSVPHPPLGGPRSLCVSPRLGHWTLFLGAGLPS